MKVNLVMSTPSFLASSIKLFAYYRNLADKSIAPLTLEQLQRAPSPNDNSMSIIMQHMAGNMLSRWTDFLTTDGEKPDRNRDAEFTTQVWQRGDLLAFWEAGWSCLENALNALAEEDLTKVVYIRNEGHSVQEAILRQLAHLPYHVGQLVYLAKWMQGDDWQSLSIPKGASASYNQLHFAKDKSRKFFLNDQSKGS